MANRIFLANVGVNASHRSQSPLFPDGTFEFVPIPEAANQGTSPMLRYRDLKSFNAPHEPLQRFVPPRLHGRWVHDDPEFTTFTYGDTCQSSPRAAALRGMEPGDYLFFLARLIQTGDGLGASEPFHGSAAERNAAGFYLIGYLHIEEIAADLRQPPRGRLMRRLAANAHVRQALASGNHFNGFSVFRGSPRSRRFVRAVPFTRQLAQRLLRDARGNPWRWDRRRSELQVIGSYTRSCRCILDPRHRNQRPRVAAWWNHILTYNDDDVIAEIAASYNA